jgi:acyl-ACP thioesterase
MDRRGQGPRPQDRKTDADKHKASPTEGAPTTAEVGETFTQRFHVRFDECAQNGTAKASAILRYVVETAFGHSTAAGYPLSWYFSHGLFWLVRRVRLVLDEPLAYGALLDVTTRVVGVRRFWARRENLVHGPTGKRVGDATMDWIFTDEAGRPGRVPNEMERAFPVTPPRAQAGRMELDDPPGDVPAGRYVVPMHQIDPAGHMNNAAYLELFEDGLPGVGFDPQERPALYELEYLRPVRAGNTLQPFVWAMRKGHAMIARHSDGTTIVRARRLDMPE